MLSTSLHIPTTQQGNQPVLPATNHNHRPRPHQHPKQDAQYDLFDVPPTLTHHQPSQRRPVPKVCEAMYIYEICKSPRKEVIQPHLPVRLPCYDLVPITGPTFDGSSPKGLGHRLRVLPTFVT